MLDSSTWKRIREYCYLHEFWIDQNFSSNKTFDIAMLEAMYSN